MESQSGLSITVPLKDWDYPWDLGLRISQERGSQVQVATERQGPGRQDQKAGMATII